MTSLLVQERERQERSLRFLLILALGGSVLFHLLLFWLLSWSSRLLPEEKPDTRPIEFRLVDPSELEPPPETQTQSTANSRDAGEAKPLPPSAGAPPRTQAAPPPAPPQPPKPQPPKPAPPPPQPVAVNPPAPKPQPPKPAPPPPPAPPVVAQQTLSESTPPPQPRPTPVVPPAPTPKATPVPAATPAPPQEQTRPSETSELAFAPPNPPETRQSEVSELAPPSNPTTSKSAPADSNPASRPSDASQLGGPVSVASNGVSGQGNSGQVNPSQSAPGNPSVAAKANIDWGPYLSRLQKRVEQNWIPGQSGTSRRTVVIFSIGRGGELLNPRLGRTSGSQQTDDAALSAIQRSSAFEPLPQGYDGSSVQINFTFDINVLGQMQGGAFSP